VVNFSNNPIEVIESEYPILIERYGYVPDSGGPGTFRGGLALVRQYRFLAREATLQLRTDRRSHLPYGLAGGHPGTPSANLLNPGTPDERVLPAKCTISVQHGDVFRHVLGGAGGWGDPRARDPELVRRDVMEEKITPEYALRHYGVAIAKIYRTDHDGSVVVRADGRYSISQTPKVGQRATSSSPTSLGLRDHIYLVGRGAWNAVSQHASHTLRNEAHGR